MVDEIVSNEIFQRIYKLKGFFTHADHSSV